MSNIPVTVFLSTVLNDKLSVEKTVRAHANQFCSFVIVFFLFVCLCFKLNSGTDKVHKQGVR